MFKYKQVLCKSKEKQLFKINKMFYGIGAFHSKYVIIGAGYAGMSLAKFLTSVFIIHIKNAKLETL
jgi:hypothetical protein